MKETKKPNFAIRAACVLLCLVLISVHFSTGLYARYVSRASGSDRGRAAAFGVSAELTPAEEGYTIELSNPSEVAVRYSVTFRAQNAGSFSEVKLGTGEPTPLGPDGSVTFVNVGTLAPNGSGSLAMIPTAVPGAGSDSADAALLDFSNDSTASLEETLPFTVTVSYEQID